MDDKALQPPMPPKGSVTYNSYLRVSDLISLQVPLAKPEAHDELLFIIIHQTYELWFKQIIFELDTLVAHLQRNDYLSTFRFLDRVCEIFRVLISQVDILETMTPTDFNRFRSHLNPASGFQSLQFRELELLAGADPADYERFATLETEWKDKLEHRRGTPNLRTALFSALRCRGLLTNEAPEALYLVIARMYADPNESLLQRLCEGFIRFDEQISLWRFRHVQMVERMIGMKAGTGGSLGVAYLRSTLRKRFFPELWEARTAMVVTPA